MTSPSTTDDLPTMHGSLLHSAVRAMAVTITVALVVALLLTVTGFLLRDRWVWSQVLMFVPLEVVGAAAVAWDVLRLGRSVKPRGALILAGLIAMGLGAQSMIGWHARPVGWQSAKQSIRLLHWNVLWGVKPEVWPTIASDIRAERADIVVLSESANHWQIEKDLIRDNDLLRSYVMWNSPPGQRYTYRLSVASRWAVTIEDQRTIPTGIAMLTRVDSPGGAIRILVIDGGSDPLQPRRPRTEAVSALVGEYAKGGRPVDLIAGDFNTPARSVGFDSLRAANWGFASESSGAWRGTFHWPWAPLWDIDHVIVAPGWAVDHTRFVSHPWCDHRGQVVELRR